MRPYIPFLVISFTFFACQQAPNPSKTFTEKRDTAIHTSNSFSTLFFDSISMEKYLAGIHIIDTGKQLFRNFYNQRNFQCAWFDSSGIAEQAISLLNMVKNYQAYNLDSSLSNPLIRKWSDSIDANGSKSIPDSVRLPLEWAFTVQFFRYASRAYLGNRNLNAEDLKWFIPRKKVDILSLLDTLVNEKGKDLNRYEPINRQYGLLRKQLTRYYEIEKNGGWESLPNTNNKLREGDTGVLIRQIKQRLFLTGDFPKADSGSRFDASLIAAVKNFQQRNGLKETGVIGPVELQQMNQPVENRIRQILVNMERLRWVPAEPAGDYLLVNIPEYRLHGYEAGNLVFNMDVVVGSTNNNTVIFTGNLKYVVFSPYWYVPPGILKKEVLPGIKRNPKYLASHNMEWNGGNVRQLPGNKNSLGLVKFLFPNSYSIYLHDTPSKSLFNESKRDFSHGCIRVSEPNKLASWILREDTTWTDKKIASAMNAGKEKYVVVKKEIPVFIGYFTAWVDRNGQLNFRDDIYGHDARMAEKMFME
jgi:murein L,D-transpeptidase YcbB/YkuD